MSIRTRTTKLIARRHDLNYFKRMSRIRAWQWYLAVAALTAAVVWFTGTSIASGNNNFSAGPMSNSHAVFGQRCELCHVPVIQATRFTPSFGRRNHVPDSACLSCHTSAPHHPMESAQNPTCSSCHTEHLGSMHLANTPDNTCTACHAKLESRAGALRVAAHVTSFAGRNADHPDFRPLRTFTAQQRDATFALRFTHATHMQPGLRNPQGGTQNLQCQSCHSPALTTVGSTELRPSFTMAPVDFDQSCRSCHSLEFDAHIHKEAPHTYPKDVRAFVQHELTAFAAEHSDVVASEIRNWPAESLLPGQMRMPAPHNTSEWIASRTLRAETILYRESASSATRTSTAPATHPHNSRPTSCPPPSTAPDRAPPWPTSSPAHRWPNPNTRHPPSCPRP